VPSSPSPAHLATNVIQTSDLSWQSARCREIITNDVYFGQIRRRSGRVARQHRTRVGHCAAGAANHVLLADRCAQNRFDCRAVWQFTTRGLDHFAWNAVSSPQAAGSRSAPRSRPGTSSTHGEQFHRHGESAGNGAKGNPARDLKAALQGFTTTQLRQRHGLWHLSTGRGSTRVTVRATVCTTARRRAEWRRQLQCHNSANGGVVTSPAITLPAGAQSLTLSFNYLMDVEAGTTWDRRMWRFPPITASLHANRRQGSSI